MFCLCSGIIPTINTSMFARIQQECEADENTQYMVTVSYLEIYKEVCGIFRICCVLSIGSQTAWCRRCTICSIPAVKTFVFANTRSSECIRVP
jgi:hypothetical protein